MHADPITELVDWQIAQGIASGEYQPDRPPRPAFTAPDPEQVRRAVSHATPAITETARVLAQLAPVFTQLATHLTAMRNALRLNHTDHQEQ